MIANVRLPIEETGALKSDGSAVFGKRPFPEESRPSDSGRFGRKKFSPPRPNGREGLMFPPEQFIKL